jgi:hypothetical protein
MKKKLLFFVPWHAISTEVILTPIAALIRETLMLVMYIHIIMSLMFEALCFHMSASKICSYGFTGGWPMWRWREDGWQPARTAHA